MQGNQYYFFDACNEPRVYLSSKPVSRLRVPAEAAEAEEGAAAIEEPAEPAGTTHHRQCWNHV